MTTFVIFSEAQRSEALEHHRVTDGVSEYVILSHRRNIGEASRLQKVKGQRVKPGDRIKVYDMSILRGHTDSLIRMMVKLLRGGVTIEIVKPGIVIEPDSMSDARMLLEVLHEPRTMVTGRKRLIAPDRLPSIQARLNVPGMTPNKLARELGVVRQTLINYLDRYAPDWRLTRGEASVRGNRRRIGVRRDTNQGQAN